MLVEANAAVSDFIIPVMMAALLVPSQKSYSIVVAFKPEYEASAAIGHHAQYTLTVLSTEGETRATSVPGHISCFLRRIWGPF
jgi:hypothetical protein